MRLKNARSIALALMIVGANICVAWTAPPDGAALTGNWKLLLVPYGDDEFAVVKLSEADGKITGSVVAAQQQVMGNATVKGAERKDGALIVTLEGTGGPTIFKGKLAKDGPGAGKYLGTAVFRGGTYPARLEPTTDSKVADLKQSPLFAKMAELQQERDPKTKIKKLEEMIRGNNGSPNSALLYGELLSAAQSAGFDADKTKELVKRWIDEARPYGDEWLSDIRIRAMKAIASSKNLAKLTVELAQEAEKGVSETEIETKATVLSLLTRAAKEAGMEKLATESEARHAKIEQSLDEAYHKKVPPFKPTAFAGRKEKTADQTVLMELFTGAQCPPCVAADVAFDALLTTYKPAEFIGLQYHLHIPGPDPLTNSDSMARQKYYGSQVQGTPSTFFNGQREGGSGGFMPNSEAKYTEYRKIIDRTLETGKGAKIALSATRDGDQIKIVATAEVSDKSASETGSSHSAKSDGKDEKSSKADKGPSKPILRLALTEESILYVGGNKLRFHHHVVRALPGGANGSELKNGKGKTEVTVSLPHVKHDLENYLSDFAKTMPFPNVLPDIKLDKLAVVAFVQDDSDKSVLYAVSVPVEARTP